MILVCHTNVAELGQNSAELNLTDNAFLWHLILAQFIQEIL